MEKVNTFAVTLFLYKKKRMIGTSKKRFLSLSQMFLIAILSVLIVMFISWALEDQKDPFWTELDTLITKDFQPISESIQPLQKLYEDFQKQDYPNDSLAFQLISTPFVPTITLEKFKKYFDLIVHKKMVVLSSVSGSGMTTLTTRLSRLLASDSKENLLKIICAPQFDLDYHKRYIGQTINGVFQKGELLQFFDKCKQHPDEMFIVLIDNFDKINPETFFGPELWEKLSDPNYEVKMGGKAVNFPNNFYLIAVTHSGISSKIELNNEHFSRLGGQYFIQPELPELILYLRDRLKSKQAALAKTPDDKKLQTEVAALSDPVNLKRFFYLFAKANQVIEEEYSRGHTLGQWSSLRKQYLPSQQKNLINSFVNHVNAFRPKTELKAKNFAPILYTIKNDGSIKGTNFFSTQLKVLEEKGFLTEFIVGLSFLLITGLVSWYFLRKRQKYIRTYTTRVHRLIEQFDAQELNYDNISEEIAQIRREVDDLVVNSKLNYTEATFFYSYMEHKLHRIEVAKSVNQSFLTLMETFLEDGVLSDGEHDKLCRFLASIKHQISTTDYDTFRKEVDRVHDLYGQ